MARPQSELWVFLDGERIGVAVRSRRGAVYFAYENDRPASATALSLSLQARGLRDATLDISSWLDGLLSDKQLTRSRWARVFGAASTDPFDLLATPAGLECAGAVQFCPEPTLPDSQGQGLVCLGATDVAAALRLLREDAATDSEQWLGTLRLSLPGAQPKMALRLSASEWHLPTGTQPTTHILKPQQAHLNPAVRDSIAVNEHLCQAAARTLGMDAARTWLEYFDGEVCLVTERFDRRVERGELRRLHFEDLCQALGFASDRKYQTDGGPTPEAIIRLLRHEGRPGDPRRFITAMFYNWLIGGTDAHSKNYGIILDGQQHMLAPLYDLSSSAPYAAAGSVLAPAMHFDTPLQTSQRWTQAAARLGVVVEVDDLQAMAEALPEAFETVAEQCPQWASQMALHVCERVIGHAQAAARRPGRSAVTPFGPTPTAFTPPSIETCGDMVKRTNRPCLLRKGHAGRHRSVL